MQEWKCGGGEKDSSSVVNVPKGRGQVRGVSDERQCQGESQRNRVKEVRGYCRQMVEPSARFSTEISRATLHQHLVQDTIYEDLSRSAQQLMQALFSCFHLNDTSGVAHEIQQEQKQHSFITCLYQRQIPQIFVYPVDSSGILCLLRAPRGSVQPDGVISLTGILRCVGVCVCFPDTVFL